MYYFNGALALSRTNARNGVEGKEDQQNNNNQEAKDQMVSLLTCFVTDPILTKLLGPTQENFEPQIFFTQKFSVPKFF